MRPKLFVAGGSGFIGSAVCQCASSIGYDVISLSRRGRPDLRAAWVDDIHWIAASVFEVERWLHELHGCAAIIDCIGIILERPHEQATYQRINTEAATILADAAVAAHWDIRPYFGFSQAPVHPSGRVGYQTKRRTWLQTYPFRTIIVRPGAVYGPQRAWSYLLKAIFDALALLPSRRAAVPLAAREVARAALIAAGTPAIRGVLDIAAIRKLA